VAGLGQDAFDTAIVASTIDLARSLGLRVAAEGVETPEQVERLRVLGCDLAQGHYFSPPEEPGRLRSGSGPGRFRPSLAEDTREVASCQAVGDEVTA